MTAVNRARAVLDEDGSSGCRQQRQEHGCIMIGCMSCGQHVAPEHWHHLVLSSEVASGEWVADHLVEVGRYPVEVDEVPCGQQRFKVSMLCCTAAGLTKTLRSRKDSHSSSDTAECSTSPQWFTMLTMMMAQVAVLLSSCTTPTAGLSAAAAPPAAALPPAALPAVPLALPAPRHHGELITETT